MSLNWEMPKKFFEEKKHLMYTPEDEKGECDVQVEFQCLIFSTMLIQHNLTGEMTDEKLREIHRRLSLLGGIGSLMSWTVWDDEIQEKQNVCLETVIRYWGLTTNVSHLTPSQWDKYFKRISVLRDSEWKWELEQAKKGASDTTKTQAQRMLDSLKAKNAKKRGDLTTPPTDQ